MRISDWSSDVCSSDLRGQRRQYQRKYQAGGEVEEATGGIESLRAGGDRAGREHQHWHVQRQRQQRDEDAGAAHAHRQRGHHRADQAQQRRSEEHTSELQSLMRISYAVFCLKKKNTTKNKKTKPQKSKY